MELRHRLHLSTLIQIRLEGAISLLLLLLLLSDLVESILVILASCLRSKIERFKDGVRRSLWILSNWEKLTRLRIGQVTLLSIDCKFVIQAENFSLSQQDFSLLFLLKFSEFKYAAETLNFYFLCRRHNMLVDFRDESAILFFIKLLIASLLSDTSHLSLLLGLEIF